MLSSARFVLSRQEAVERYGACKSLSDIVSFSYKTNNEVGKVLEESTDSMFTVHMHNTLPKIMDKSRVWFCAQAWDKDEINRLLDEGVRNFIIDNREDLTHFTDLMEGCKNTKQDKGNTRDSRKKDTDRCKVNVMLRMRLRENTIHTGKYFVFGMYSEEINRLIPGLRKKDYIGKLGVHFHRKTQNISEWSLKDEIISVLSEETFASIDFLDIGGGLPVAYKNFREDVMPGILARIKETKAWLNSLGIRMIIEPGRFIAAPAVKLEASIVNVYNNTIIINCSVYNSAVDTIAANIKLLVDGELPDREGEHYTIKGSTPCSMDIFRYRVNLKSPKVGDRITFLNAGAYNFATDFCNLKKLDTVVVD